MNTTASKTRISSHPESSLGPSREPLKLEVKRVRIRTTVTGGVTPTKGLACLFHNLSSLVGC